MPGTYSFTYTVTGANSTSGGLKVGCSPSAAFTPPPYVYGDGKQGMVEVPFSGANMSVTLTTSFICPVTVSYEFSLKNYTTGGTQNFTSLSLSIIRVA